MDQCEYATDIVFRKQADLAAIYGNLARTAIHTVKPDNIATFLGRKLSTQYEGEMGNRFNIRIEGTRIKHTMGPVSLKLYDKFGLILRIETTVNDLTFFKHYREVEHRDGTRETKWAPMQKTIYSLPALREMLEAANRRYSGGCTRSNATPLLFGGAGRAHTLGLDAVTVYLKTGWQPLSQPDWFEVGLPASRGSICSAHIQSDDAAPCLGPLAGSRDAG